MSKGGVYGGFIPFTFPGGTSWKFEKVMPGSSVEKQAASKQKEGSNKSPIAYVKEPVGLYFGLKKPKPGDRTDSNVKTKKLTINGITHEVKSAVKSGSTGKSRSVTVKFKTLQKIGGKEVASVNIAMPASFTMTNMIDFLTKGPKRAQIASIVSPEGNSWVYQSSSIKAATRRSNK
jgi:hypothetical protein